MIICDNMCKYDVINVIIDNYKALGSIESSLICHSFFPGIIYGYKWDNPEVGNLHMNLSMTRNFKPKVPLSREARRSLDWQESKDTTTRPDSQVWFFTPTLCWTSTMVGTLPSLTALVMSSRSLGSYGLSGQSVRLDASWE